MTHPLQTFQPYRPGFREGPHPGSSQSGHMRTSLEASGKVSHEGADVSSLTAFYLDNRVIRVWSPHEPRCVDDHLSRPQIHGHALSRQIVGARAVHLYG